MIVIGVGNDVDYCEFSYIVGKYVIMLMLFDEVFIKVYCIIDEFICKVCGQVSLVVSLFLEVINNYLLKCW